MLPTGYRKSLAFCIIKGPGSVEEGETDSEAGTHAAGVEDEIGCGFSIT